MMQFSTDKRVFIVTTYLRTGSLQQVRDKFARHFHERTSPTKRTNLKTVSKYYRIKGTVLNVNQKYLLSR